MKNIISIIITLILGVSILPDSVFATKQSNTLGEITFKSDLDVSNEAKEIYNTEGHKNANKSYLNLNSSKYKNTFLSMNLNISEDNEVDGDAVVKVEDSTFPFKFSGKLKKYNLSTQENVLYGTILGKTKNTKDIVAAKLFVDPKNNDNNVVILTVGDTGAEEGIGFVAFGEQEAKYKETIKLHLREQETKHSQEQLDNKSESYDVLPTEETKEEEMNGANDEPTSFVRAANGQKFAFNNNFFYQTFAATSNFEFEDETYSTTVDGIWGNSDTSGTADNWVIGMHTHMRGPDLNDGSLGYGTVRVYSNTSAVENFVQDFGFSTRPTATVSDVYVYFGIDNEEPDGRFDIYKHKPADDEPVDSTSWSYASYIPTYGQAIQLFGQAYTAIVNANPDVASEVKRKDSSNVDVEELEKSFHNIDSTATDYSSNSSYKPALNDEYGGITAEFGYTEALDGYAFLFAKSRIMYDVTTTSPTYSGIYASDEINDWIYQNMDAN